MINAQAVKRVALISPRTSLATATAAGSTDRAGAEYAWITFACCAELNTNATGPSLAVQHADDTNASSFSTTGITAAETLDNTSAALKHFGVDLRGKKRYIRLLVTPATSSNDTIAFSADCELYRLAEAPSSTSDMVGSTNDAVTLVD